MKTPAEFIAHQQNWAQNGDAHIAQFCRRACDFIPHLLPETAVAFPVETTLDILRRRYGNSLDLAISERATHPETPIESLPEFLHSPVKSVPDGRWLKRVKMVGINVRTIANFWNIVAYTFTLPPQQSSIHLLPIWEPGVVGSLYGMSSWQINREFFCEKLAEQLPHLNTVERQLRAVINISHLTGRTVGMDVIPHTDRFSEMGLAFPEHFEWLRRKGLHIVDHRANLHEMVQQQIFYFLQKNGAAGADLQLPGSAAHFFSATHPESSRLKLLFGQPDEPEQRKQRRIALIKHLHTAGYEPVPATMGPPYRGLLVDESPAARKIDENGLEWRDFRIAKPEDFSRVFGPLARYKLFESIDDNRDWQIDFSHPRPAVWQYVCEHYADVQRRFGFDFMRGDMAHVQMRPEGVPVQIPQYYDLLKFVKQFIRTENRVPYFGYFAESFLAPPNVIGYGDEIEHLEASDADSTLGDLQSMVVGSAEFQRNFRLYSDIAKTRAVTPNFTMMTADKDDPRFDKFYVNGNELRHFIGQCLPMLPAYMALGFEMRDPHQKPAPNEHYSKLFVFQEKLGEKATNGSFVWGKNVRLFENFTRLNLLLSDIWQEISESESRWILPPDMADYYPAIAWTAAIPAPQWLFVANLDTEKAAAAVVIPARYLANARQIERIFSTADQPLPAKPVSISGSNFRIAEMLPGEGQIYQLSR